MIKKKKTIGSYMIIEHSFFFFCISILISKSEFAFPNIENMDKNSLKYQGLN